MMNDVAENRLVATLTAGFARSALQLNGLQEADAELLRLEADTTLALTTDSIAEELACGLYPDPHLAGWVSVMASLSDLAAVGAEPLGLLMAEILPPSCTPEFLSRLQQGIGDACRAAGTFVLGGDTNSGRELALTATAVGRCSGSAVLSRLGCRPGDRLYATGPLGAGNAYALQVLGLGSGDTAYSPRARLREGQGLRGIASACMDSSDGVLATLDQLARLNRVGFELDQDWPDRLDPLAVQTARRAGLAEWLLLAGQHGEFELLFTVPRARVAELAAHVRAGQWQPLPLGEVVASPGIVVPVHGRRVPIDTGRIRDVANALGSDPPGYLRELLKIDQSLRAGETR